MSDGTYPFVEKVMDYTRQDSQFLPPFIEAEELEKDWSVVTNLLPTLRKIQQLESNLDDTVMMAGSEVYQGR